MEVAYEEVTEVCSTKSQESAEDVKPMLAAASKRVTFQKTQVHEFVVEVEETREKDRWVPVEPGSDHELGLQVFLQAVGAVPALLERKVSMKRLRDFGSN